MNLTFSELQAQVSRWSHRNFPNNTSQHPLLGVFEEAGELSHAHLKAMQGIRGTPEEHRAAKEDAVADIIIYLADYCARENISMQVAVETAWDQVRQRDWIKFPTNGKTH